MPTRDEIVARIAEIDARLTAGAQRVTHGDSSVSYDFEELRRRRAELSSQLAAIDGRPRRVRHIRTYSSKGL